MSTSTPAHTSTTRPLDPAAAALVVVLCLSWGFNQVATKLAIHDIPPLMQGAIRSAVATLLVAAWCKARGIPLFTRDGTLAAGLIAGVLFGGEFIFIYQGLVYTTATRATLFIYLAPFFVVLGARILLPVDRFSLWQWLGPSHVVCRHGGGVRPADAGARSAPGDRRPDDGGRGAVVGRHHAADQEKRAQPRIVGEGAALSARRLRADAGAGGAAIAGERIAQMPSAVAIGALAYQTLWIVSVTFALWFALIVRYSANRLSAFTFLTPLFGVAAGHLVLGEPLTLAFGAAVVLTAGGLILVNRAR